MKPRTPLIAAVVLVACGTKPELPPDGAITTPYSPIAVRNDSTLHAIVALEDSLRRDSTSAETPRRLYRLGRMIATNYLDLGRGTPDTAFMVGRDSMYWYNEIGGGYLYQGNHFRDIARRFPSDTFAVLAAWEIALLPQGGECEGYVGCYVSRGFMPADEFLRKHPRSRLARVAVDSATEAFDRALQYGDSLKPGAEELDSADVRKSLARFDSTLTMLPDSLRARGYAALAPWVEKYGNVARATEMRSWLSLWRGR